ncbi:MAG: OmpA family protein [Paludibacteraceae bacterium]|nr:OmpA family protein [Paludibacteraceae bacterium]
MKKFILFTTIMALALPVNAQFWHRLGSAVENAAKDAAVHQAERVTERAIDSAVEGAENEAYSATEEAINDSKSKNKKDKEEKANTWKCPKCGHKGNTGKFCTECGAKKPEAEGAWFCPNCGAKNTGKFCTECGTPKPGAQAAQPAHQHDEDEEAAPAQQPAKPKENARATSEWNKFDFVPGDEVIFYDQLDGEQLGEFPSKWELLEGEAEIQKVDGENVIAVMNGARIMPLMKNTWNYLPDVYTIEFDYYEFLEKDGEDYGEIMLKTMPADDHGLHWSLWEINFHNYIGEANHSYWKDDSKDIRTTFSDEAITTGKGISNTNHLDKVEINAWHHISISVNKRAVKIYYDETRVLNVPNYKNPNGGYFGFHYCYADTQYPAYIKNVRFAKGAKPLYDRMMTDGKFITYGITFDVGKAVIKPESMGEINRIVKLMNDNPELKFEVQGHTDNTGNAASNQTLSEKRAQAIVAKLVEMGIKADRLTAVGKGQTNPIADNSTDEGRAKNRRVEFVKQ